MPACRWPMLARKTAGKSSREPVTVLPIGRSVYSIELACKLRKNSALLHRLLCENRIPLAFWLVQALAPAIFVELGTSLDVVFFILSGGGGPCGRHRGALWSWRGDSHTGFYDESVFARMNACNERKYAGFPRSLRTRRLKWRQQSAIRRNM